MGHLDNDVCNEFFRGSFVKGLVKKAGLDKEAFDQDGYYEADKQGPTVADEVAVAHPGGGQNTQVANSGGGGEGVYDVAQSDVSATGPCADGHVETITEAAPYHEDVARKAPTGVQGSSVKGLAKKASPVVKASRSLLQKLAQIAQELDDKGLREEADQIDAIIAEETGSVEEAQTEEADEVTETTEA